MAVNSAQKREGTNEFRASRHKTLGLSQPSANETIGQCSSGALTANHSAAQKQILRVVHLFQQQAMPEPVIMIGALAKKTDTKNRYYEHSDSCGLLGGRAGINGSMASNISGD